MSLKRPISTESNVLQPAKISKILFCPKDFNVKRVRLINKLSDISMDGTCVIYWMGRDQRVYDNYALLYAQGLAMDLKLPLKVVFNLVPTFLSATIRQYDFMLKGLQEVESQLRDLNIPFYLLMGDPTINIPTFVTNHNASAIVSDFSPIRIVRNWFRNVASLLGKKPDQSTSSSLDIQYRLMPFYEVDARNVIPCWITSDKLEYGARTIRPKIQSKFPEFLTEISPPVVNPFGSLDDCPLTNWINIEASLQVDRSVREVDWLVPGPSGALATLEKFIAEGLREFAIRRNDPNHSVASNLSPYIHFGQISVQRVVLRLKSLKQFAGSVDIFI
jgi:deoxyribodipyrimidine photo-lyase